MPNYEKALQALKTAGFRVTKPRQELIRYLLAQKGHWTIQTLAAEVSKELPSIGLATIYRTVALLQKQKLLTETRLGSGAARYEISPKQHHDHLTCLTCGKIFEFKNERIESLQDSMAAKLGFALVDHRMELFGDCRRKACPNNSAS